MRRWVLSDSEIHSPNFSSGTLQLYIICVLQGQFVALAEDGVVFPHGSI